MTPEAVIIFTYHDRRPDVVREHYRRLRIDNPTCQVVPVTCGYPALFPDSVDTQDIASPWLPALDRADKNHMWLHCDVSLWRYLPAARPRSRRTLHFHGMGHPQQRHGVQAILRRPLERRRRGSSQTRMGRPQPTRPVVVVDGAGQPASGGADRRLRTVLLHDVQRRAGPPIARFDPQQITADMRTRSNECRVFCVARRLGDDRRSTRSPPYVQRLRMRLQPGPLRTGHLAPRERPPLTSAIAD